MSEIDGDTFRLMYEKYWNKVYKYANRIFEDKAIAEDIVQQVFVSLWERRDSLQIDHIEAYLIRAVKYACFSEIKNKHRYAESSDVAMKCEKSDLATDGPVLYKDLENAIDKLLIPMADKSQKMFRMRYEEGLDNHSIASYFQLSEKTIRNKLSIIIGDIREKLKVVGYK